MTRSSNNSDEPSDSARRSLERATLLSAFILAFPPLLAVAAAAFPGYVPVPFADVGDVPAIRPVLAGLGLLLLLLNGFALWWMRQRFLT